MKFVTTGTAMETLEILETLKLGESRDSVDLATSTENRLAAVAMVKQARLSIEIVSRNLDPPVYDNPAFVEALKDLILGHRRASVRVLVHDPAPIARSGHRVLELARRLSSYFDIRVPATQHKDFNHALLVADETGYVFRELSDRYEAVSNFNDPGQARYYTREFDKMWEVAKPDPNLRQLKI